MICSKCGGKTAVVATRCPMKPGKGAEVNKVSKVVSWYCSDFVARRRKCTQCGAHTLTVELSVEDVQNMMKEAAHLDVNEESAS